MSLRKLPVFAFILLFMVSVCHAAPKVETIKIPSAAMKKDFPATVILPEAYLKNPSAKFPVLYMLHGHGGNHSNWPLFTSIAQDANQHQFIVVCPDGAIDSWYFDIPNDPTHQFETYVSKEVVAYIDSHYRTIKDTTGRAISGLSMGGHGGLYLGFRHPEVYGACGATSGGVDLRPFPDNWGIKDRLGTLAEHPDVWKEHSVVTVAEKLKPDTKQAIFFDCGSEDFFTGVNRNLHQLLLNNKIAHTYLESPGGHAWPYWQNSIHYQTLFFHLYFEAHKPGKEQPK